MDKESIIPSLSGKARILIASGFSANRFDLRACLDKSVNICGIMTKSKKKENIGTKLPVPLWLYEQLFELSPEFSSTNVHEQYEGCLRSVLSDPRTVYFCERFYGKQWDNSTFNNTVQVELACWNSLAILKETSPDRLVFTSLAHRLPTWIFGRCAEYLGIPTYFAVESPLPWRFWAIKGIDQQQVVDVCSDQVGRHRDNLSEETFNYIEKNSQSYTTGMPPDQKKILDDGIWSWKRELQQILSWRPIKLAINTHRLKRKYKLFKTYNKLSKTAWLSDRYIVFFLHYQPEETTLPRGLGYVQQWLAIRALAAALPDGCKLVIKEHPAIFGLSDYTRDKSVYEAIAGLPHVTIAPIEADPFELIDSSIAVVTLTGTAGFQAICRGRPVLVFGAAAYKDCPGVYAVHNIQEVSNALQTIISGKDNPTRAKLYEYLKWVEKYSVEGLYGNDKREHPQLKIWERLIMAENEPPVVSFAEKQTV